ncbi:DUF742 domain-containing protein [Yinghuangia aomiensis]
MWATPSPRLPATAQRPPSRSGDGRPRRHVVGRGRRTHRAVLRPVRRPNPPQPRRVQSHHPDPQRHRRLPRCPGWEPEHTGILRLCTGRPLSVAEIAAKLDLPPTVVKVLLGDLLDLGAIHTRAPIALAEAPRHPRSPGGTRWHSQAPRRPAPSFPPRSKS